MSRTKICSICNLCKEIKEFSPHYKSRDRLQGHCKECHNIINKRWRDKNREKHREKTKIYQRIYRKTHQEQIKITIRKSYLKHREKRLLDKRNKNLELKLRIINHYGKKCECCGESDYRFLCIDHKNNDGYRHRKNGKGRTGWQLYNFIINNNYPNYFRILCFNCNFGRAFYGGKEKICPHRLARNTQD